jgi:hypothetical protein
MKAKGILVIVLSLLIWLISFVISTQFYYPYVGEFVIMCGFLLCICGASFGISLIESEE